MSRGFITLSEDFAGYSRRYQIYVPCEYSPEKKWPIILFLHGAGEGGTDALLPTEYQIGSAIRRNPERYPCLVLFPQVQNKGGWTNEDLVFAHKTLVRARNEYNIDSNRIYLTGVSSGGKGAWSLLNSYPKLFSAALIVCGRLLPPIKDGVRALEKYPILSDVSSKEFDNLAQSLLMTPIWVFHGDNDPIFNVIDVRLAVSRLAARNVPITYTELNGFGHDVWDIAYYSKEVISWLLSHRRSI